MGTASKSFALVLIMLFLTSLVVLPPNSVNAQSKTITVPDDYTDIQAAIDHANAGDTVFVKEGTYNGSLNIDKPLFLIGENSQTTVITSSEYSSMYHRYIINIGSGVTISGFTIVPRYDLSGIFASGGLNHDLSDCKIIGNNLINAGIEIWDDVYVLARIIPFNKPLNIISENNITGDWNGISVEASNTEVSNNKLSNNPRVGIVTNYASNVTIKDNSISNNSMGIGLGSWGTYYVYDNNITDSASFGIQFQHCNKAIVYNNSITHSNIGVSLQNYALYNYSNNYSGIIGSENKFYGNKLIDNIKNVVVEHAISNDTINGDPIGNATDIVSWDNGVVGNYWSDYRGHGFYVIDQNNIDHYPLAKQVDVSAIVPTPAPTQQNLVLILPIAFIVVLAVIVSLLLLIRHRKTANFDS
jgi:parallel beta-helix repeat protein